MLRDAPCSLAVLGGTHPVELLELEVLALEGLAHAGGKAEVGRQVRDEVGLELVLRVRPLTLEGDMVNKMYGADVTDLLSHYDHVRLLFAVPNAIEGVTVARPGTSSRRSGA